MAIESVNPATGETIRTFTPMTGAEVETAIAAAHGAFLDWRDVPFEDRAARMSRAAEVLRAGRDTYAAIMTEEMGKTTAEARAEVEKCAWVCEYYAEHAEAMLADEDIETDASLSYVAVRPLGVILAIMPWNFPFWQVFRFAAPGLMAGNAAVLKHASNVPGCALAIEEVFRLAGFPEDLFRTLLIGSDGVEAVLEHPRIAAVTLTGSTPAGRAVAAKAGALLKKAVLELGGSDPYVILEDADLDLAVEACVTGRLHNAGQSCIAAKRFIVPRAIADDFEARFVTAMAGKRMGDPTAAATDLGPQARRELRDELHGQVLRSIEAGARCVLGGTVPEGPGAFYPPTVLTDVGPGMPAYDEELFGPVASIIRVDDESAAIRVANDTSFGLGAAVFTSDILRGEAIAADALDAGSCFVNGFVKSDPRLPFGGIKESGFGRELGRHGILEFVNIKTIWVR